MKKKILSLSIILMFGLALAGPAMALNLQDAFRVDNGQPGADCTGDANDILDTAACKAGYNIAAQDTANTVSGIVAKVIQAALSILGVVFLVLMIYGGYLWMLDRGNEEQVKKARNLIQAAIIGMIIVIVAYAISYYVIKTLGAGQLQGL